MAIAIFCYKSEPLVRITRRLLREPLAFQQGAQEFSDASKGAFLTLTERSRHRLHLDVCSQKHLLLRCIS
jgi:hypothetical protein